MLYILDTETNMVIAHRKRKKKL